MKHIGAGMFALLFLVQACGDDTPPSKQDLKKAAAKKTEAVAGGRQKSLTADAGTAVGPADPNAVVSLASAVRIYDALLATANGSEPSEGTCGTVDEKFDRGRVGRKIIRFTLPYKNCKVDGLEISGKLVALGNQTLRTPKPAGVAGRLQLTGEVSGVCDIDLRYPLASFFALVEDVAANPETVGAVEADLLEGSLCGTDIAAIRAAKAAADAEGDATADAETAAGVGAAPTPKPAEG